jgi:hypothetical protein
MSKAASLPIGGKRNEAILFEGCQLERENEALRKDAERYRWLKDQQRMAYGDTAVINWNIGHDWQRINSENLDSAIDAAIKEQSHD